MTFDKPFKSYNELLLKLKNDYGLNINNDNFAVQALKSISYYDLVNGYKEIFLLNGKFHRDIDLLQLFKFSVFDKDFQNILFKYSIYVENIFKTKLAYVISKKYGVDINRYLSLNNFVDLNQKKSAKRLSKLKDTVKYILNEANNTKDNPTKFYCETHNHVPAWILFKNIKFNSVIDLYSFLKSQDKHEMILEYFPENNATIEEMAKLLKDMLSVVRDFRNKIAHNLKFISYKSHFALNLQMLKNAFQRATITNFRFSANAGKNDVLAFLLSLIFLLDNDYLVISMITEILFLFESDTSLSDRYIKEIGMPVSIKSLLTDIKFDSSIRLSKFLQQ